nr:YciI family protein [Polynucleobacter necessarius]
MDRPGTAELRVQVRPENRAYLGQQAERIAFAGPLTSDDGNTVLGSLLVMDFPSRAAVEEWLSNEPWSTILKHSTGCATLLRVGLSGLVHTDYMVLPSSLNSTVCNSSSLDWLVRSCLSRFPDIVFSDCYFTSCGKYF